MENESNSTVDWQRADTEWFRACGWGVFVHYLGKPETTVDEWNRRIDGFDVEALAGQLASVGAPYFFVTLGQNSGHYLVPNSAYDEIVGIKPSKCSCRDLVPDLYDALHPRGIHLLVYSTGNAPSKDPIAVEKFGWRDPATSEDKRLAGFQQKWEAVHREWSLRWGAKVRGWWVDGCYVDEMYNHGTPPNYQSFVESMKAGNPEAIVALNTGVSATVKSCTKYEDYTAGELSCDLPVGGWWGKDFPEYSSYGPIRPLVNGEQYHVLNFLGRFWSAGAPRFPTELVAGYTRYINSHGGVVTWDVPTNADGTIAPAFLEQLAAVGESCGRRKT